MTWQRRTPDGETICVEELRDHFLLKFWGFVVPIFVSNHALQRQAERGLSVAGLGRTLLRLGPLILAYTRSGIGAAIIDAQEGHTLLLEFPERKLKAVVVSCLDKVQDVRLSPGTCPVIV